MNEFLNLSLHDLEQINSYLVSYVNGFIIFDNQKRNLTKVERFHRLRCAKGQVEALLAGIMDELNEPTI